MLQNPCKTLGFKKNMVYKIPPGGGGVRNRVRVRVRVSHIQPVAYKTTFTRGTLKLRIFYDTPNTYVLGAKLYKISNSYSISPNFDSLWLG